MLWPWDERAEKQRPLAALSISRNSSPRERRSLAVGRKRSKQMPDDDESKAEETDNSGESSEETSDTFEFDDERFTRGTPPPRERK